MAKGDPNISITVENNTFTPSILFCPIGDGTTLVVTAAKYTDLGDKEFDLIDSIIDDDDGDQGRNKLCACPPFPDGKK